MSCLSITELPLAEQAELELAYAQRLVDRIDALLRADPPPTPVRHPQGAGNGHTLPRAGWPLSVLTEGEPHAPA